MLNKKEIVSRLVNSSHTQKSYDLITTKTLNLNYSYAYGFGKNHKPEYLKILEDTIRDIAPAYLPTYLKLVHEKHTYFGNMMICRRPLYNAYMHWLFQILFSMDQRMIIDEPDSYHRRIYGFISEFLLYVYCQHHALSVHETMVGMVGEKVEVREIKAVLSRYLEAGDWQSAKHYFLQEYKKRPDILMEASDVNQELHLSMEVISIAEHEADSKNIQLEPPHSSYDWTPLLSRQLSFPELMKFCRKLNHFVQLQINGMPDKTEDTWMKKQHVSPYARYVAQQMFQKMTVPSD